jgi:transposase-like protein
VRDALIVCHDGLSGFAEAIEATWPQSIMQTCTVNMIRAAMRLSLNDQPHKIIQHRRHFPNDDAPIKLLWLAVRDIEDKRARARAKEKGLPANERRAPGRLAERRRRAGLGTSPRG